MTRTARIIWSVATVSTMLAGLGAGGARAAAPIGQTFEPTAACTNVLVTQLSSTAPARYSVPAPGGVITSWQMQVSPRARQSARLEILRPRDSHGDFQVMAETTLHHLKPGQLNVFPTRLRAAPGDRIALFAADADCAGAGTPGNGLGYAAGRPSQGSIVVIGRQAHRTALDLGTTLEADADRDGYGDETQDGCPADPWLHAGPCAADLSVRMTVNHRSATMGNPVVFNVHAVNRGSSATPAVLTDSLPAGLAPISIATTAGQCHGVRPIICVLGPLARGGSATVTIVARTGAPGPVTNTAQISGSIADPEPLNNVSSATTLVQAPQQPFAGVSILARAVRPKHGLMLVRLRCAGSTPAECAGRLTLRMRLESRGHRVRIRTVGAAAFALRPGAARSVRVRLTRAALASLAGNRHLWIKAVATAHDGAGRSRTTAARIRLQAGRR